MGIFKKLSDYDYNVIPFNAHKTYTYNGNNSGSGVYWVEGWDIGIETFSPNATTSIIQSSYRSAKYSISISDATGSDYQVTEVHVVHDGTNASLSQFGTVLQGGSTELGTFTVDISGGNLRLRVASASSNSTVYKFKRIDHAV